MSDKNGWTGWMIFKKKGDLIGLVQSSFGLSKADVEASLKARGRSDEFVRRVSLTLESD